LREWLARDRVTQAGRPPLTLNDEYIPAPKDDAF
jgi:hypothetical protein